MRVVDRTRPRQMQALFGISPISSEGRILDRQNFLKSISMHGTLLTRNLPQKSATEEDVCGEMVATRYAELLSAEFKNMSCNGPEDAG